MTTPPPISVEDVDAAMNRASPIRRDAEGRMVARSKPSKPDPRAEADLPPDLAHVPSDGDPVLVRLADVPAQAVRWLWPLRFPRGRVSVLAGRPGEGKSFATADWAARVTTGRAWPDGAACERGDVLMISGEDDPADTLRPRLDAHGADVERVHLLRAVHRRTPGGRIEAVMFTLADLDALERALKQRPAVLVIVDPVGSFIGGRVDAHRDNEVRAVLAPLADLAERSGAAMLLVAHVRKGAGSHADDLVLGSRAFNGLARSVVHLLADPQDPERRLLLPGKSNLSRKAPGLAFRIGGEPARLMWEDGSVDLTADGVIGEHSGRDGGAFEEACEWLRDVLSDGPVAAADVKARAKADGVAARTLDRAKKALGVKADRAGFANDGAWTWTLPPPSAP